MKPYQDNHITNYNQDFRTNELPDELVQMVVTSPPYWGLRKYSGEQELVWGDNHCEHKWIVEEVIGEVFNRRGRSQEDDASFQPRQSGSVSTVTHERSFCSLCGAWKGAYGLEPTPEMYVQHTIEILREIRRVLRKDGVVFWNIGDSYATHASGGKGYAHNFRAPDVAEKEGIDQRKPTAKSHGLKEKDLCLIPFRVALEAQKPYQEFTIKELSDRAWLAGIVDADGCIGIHHYERKWKDVTYHQFQPYISVGCSDKEMTDRCVVITRMNGTRSTNRPPIDQRGVKSNRPHHEWRIEGENAAKILEDIYPILVVKEKQARLAHAVWRSNQETKGGKSNPIPPKVTEYRLNLWDTIKQCNQREEVVVKEPPVPPHIEPGWWVRSIIIWSKPNPMPESVQDRPTESHEYILMLTKNAKYYWDADAVRMPIADSTIGRGPVDFGGAKGRDYQPTADDPNYRAGSEQWGRTYNYNGGGRNIRTVWEFPTQPYPDAHFAVFPEKLPETCIKAATPEVGCCSKCGAPWERVTERKRMNRTELPKDDPRHRPNTYNGAYADINGKGDAGYTEVKTIGWQPTCECNGHFEKKYHYEKWTEDDTKAEARRYYYEYVPHIPLEEHPKKPSVVLDPFAGAGTTLWVAKKLGRRAVGYEISEEYCQLIVDRNRQQAFT